MKRYLIMLVAILTMGIVAVNAANDKVIMKAVKSNMDFTAIEVNGLIRVVIEKRTEGNIIIRSIDRLMPHIKLEVEGKTLKISSDLKQINQNDNIPIAEVYLPYNGHLCSFEATAVSSIDIKPFISSKKLDIECVGGSSITIDAKTDKASIEVAGASRVKAAIECVSMNAEVAGAATLTLEGSATKADMEVAGAATLNADKFNCSQLETEVVGASKATVKADICTIDVVGASSATVECTTQLNASAIGASSIRYIGDCQVNIIENMGASSIKKK